MDGELISMNPESVGQTNRQPILGLTVDSRTTHLWLGLWLLILIRIASSRQLMNMVIAGIYLWLQIQFSVYYLRQSAWTLHIVSTGIATEAQATANEAKVLQTAALILGALAHASYTHIPKYVPALMNGEIRLVSNALLLKMKPQYSGPSTLSCVFLSHSGGGSEGPVQLRKKENSG